MKFINFKIILLILLILNISHAFGQISSLEKARKLIKMGNNSEAEIILVEAVKAGNVKAIRFYSISLIKGNFFHKNLPKAISVLKEGAKFNDPISAYTLGNFFSNGEYLKPNYERASHFYNIALKNGMKKAKIKIDQIASKLIKKENFEVAIIPKAVPPQNIKPQPSNPKQATILGFSLKVPSWKEDYINWDEVRGFGSAFAITNNGKFVTNEHVVNGCKKIFIKYKEKYKIANLIFKVKKQDIAVIDIKASTPSFFGFRKDKIKLGQELMSGGYPLPDQLDLDIKITTGIVSSSGKNRQSKNFGDFQHTVPTQPGNSGGPLISRSGQILGMTKSMLVKSDKHIPQNVNFAVTAATIKNYLKKNNISYYLNNDNNKYNFENLASRLEQTAAQVICY